MHIFSPRALNTFRAGFSRAAFDFDSVLRWRRIPANLSFVAGSGPGGIVISGGLTTTGARRSPPPGRTMPRTYGIAAICLPGRTIFRSPPGGHQISAGVWFQRLQDNENTASTTLGQANFTNLQTFLQGTISNFNVVPNRTGLGWRTLLGAWYVEDTIRLRPNLTLAGSVSATNSQPAGMKWRGERRITLRIPKGFF